MTEQAGSTMEKDVRNPSKKTRLTSETIGKPPHPWKHSITESPAQKMPNTRSKRRASSAAIVSTIVFCINSSQKRARRCFVRAWVVGRR